MAIKNISGILIAQFRKSCSPALTQKELADRVRAFGIKLDRAAIAKIENGLRAVRDYELVAIARVLNVSPMSLLGLSPKKPRKRNRSGK